MIEIYTLRTNANPESWFRWLETVPLEKTRQTFCDVYFNGISLKKWS